MTKRKYNKGFKTIKCSKCGKEVTGLHFGENLFNILVKRVAQRMIVNGKQGWWCNDCNFKPSPHKSRGKVLSE